jgi:tRNA wybutosine-synthesizing protein 3
MPLPPIPSSFTRKKTKILQDLAVPESEYSDKSPKGSVDEGIKELIDKINAYDGLLTTSSCAGRISVYLEGAKGADEGDGENGSNVSKGSNVPGGKGGGEFLFVSHEPVEVSEDDLERLAEVFGGAGDGEGSALPAWNPRQRFVRFAFEPMVDDPGSFSQRIIN